MIKSIFESFREKKPTIDNSLNRVYLMLHEAQQRRDFVEVTIEGSDAVYQSIILELDPDERTILIDEFFPAGFRGMPGQLIHVRIRQAAGRALLFTTSITESHVHEDTPLYVLTMPLFLDTDQRRGAYRLPVTEDWPVESTFISPDRELLNARIRNVSATGLCMEIKGVLEDEFQRDDELSHVAFDFAGNHYDCGLKIKNILTEEDPIDHTLIGAEFINFPPGEGRLLERTIMRMQRDRVRYAEGDLAHA